MTRSLSRAVFGFAVLLIGLATMIYAIDVAHDGANADSEVVNAFHPAVEAVVPVLPFLLFILAAFGMIGAGAYLKQAGSGGVGGGLR